MLATNMCIRSCGVLDSLLFGFAASLLENLSIMPLFATDPFDENSSIWCCFVVHICEVDQDIQIGTAYVCSCEFKLLMKFEVSLCFCYMKRSGRFCLLHLFSEPMF